MSAYDDLIPDGMPLVWCLNRAGRAQRPGLRTDVHAALLETVPAAPLIIY